MSNTSKFEFTLAEDEQGQRLAYRALVHGIEARIGANKATLPVADISVSGCAFQLCEGFSTKEGDILPLQLEVRGRVIIAQLRAQVIRVTGRGMVACTFMNLSERQEYALDKLVLEIQKRLIEMKKL